MLEMGSFKDDFKLPKYTGQEKKEKKGSNVDPAISGTFPIIRKLIYFYLQNHSICKFCTFEVWTCNICLVQDQALRQTTSKINVVCNSHR